MRKGVQISVVEITNGRVIAKDADRDVIRTSRTQRNALMNYKNPNYTDNVKRAFNSDKVLSDTFTVYDNGEKVFG